DTHAIRRVQAGISRRIDLFELGMQGLTALQPKASGKMGPQLVRGGWRPAQAIYEKTDVQGRGPGDNRHLAARMNVRNGLHGKGFEPPSLPRQLDGCYAISMMGNRSHLPL